MKNYGKGRWEIYLTLRKIKIAQEKKKLREEIPSSLTLDLATVKVNILKMAADILVNRAVPWAVMNVLEPVEGVDCN